MSEKTAAVQLRAPTSRLNSRKGWAMSHERLEKKKIDTACPERGEVRHQERASANLQSGGACERHRSGRSSDDRYA